MTHHKNRLIETVLMRGHKICFRWEIRKIIFELSSVLPLIWSSWVDWQWQERQNKRWQSCFPWKRTHLALNKNSLKCSVLPGCELSQSRAVGDSLMQNLSQQHLKRTFKVSLAQILPQIPMFPLGAGETTKLYLIILITLHTIVIIS